MSYSLLPDKLQVLLQEFAKLPGVGEKTALRYCVSLLRNGNDSINSFAKCMSEVADNIKNCPLCHYWMNQHDEHCSICSDLNRRDDLLCVVRDSPDVMSLERFRRHPWKYHILQGLISPLSGVNPEDIKLDSLFTKIKDNQIKEIIIAFDSTVEGDATALYIKEKIKQMSLGEITLTRTSQGMPAGSSVEFLDSSTLESALAYRVPL